MVQENNCCDGTLLLTQSNSLSHGGRNTIKRLHDLYLMTRVAYYTNMHNMCNIKSLITSEIITSQGEMAEFQSHLPYLKNVTNFSFQNDSYLWFIIVMHISVSPSHHYYHHASKIHQHNSTPKTHVLHHVTNASQDIT